MAGSPYIQNYSSENYNTPEDQIWSIIQDTQGLMYFANNNGVLEFDGNTWRLIEIPNKSTIRSFALDQNTGIIYKSWLKRELLIWKKQKNVQKKVTD